MAPGATAEFADAVRRVERSIAAAVAALIEADVDAEHRLLLANAVVGMAEGVLRNGIADGTLGPAEHVSRQLAEMAWAGLRGVRRLT